MCRRSKRNIYQAAYLESSHNMFLPKSMSEKSWIRCDPMLFGWFDLHKLFLEAFLLRLRISFFVLLSEAVHSLTS